ncbi:paraquat-inducible membrane protein A [Marinobacter halodurans]|uniref:Paraquat-inducible membrane protein A n=1 Tax=Marinobacter halodurans TaxID=2528979 RepID=A0ABY1ZEW8_9GAMM|nr:paraquat-inducible protein A [Marinobacter halodurans]TBW49090.1 paraquat-inducible membrane protein A [Marinobacter halodurans]
MTPPVAAELGLCLCHHCHLACELERHPHVCPRCGAHLHRRKRSAIARTWALVLTALILYIPANVLPIMHTSSFKGDSTTTILGSVVTLWQEGAWDIATIIFVASVGVPVTKFLVLGLLLCTVHRGSERSRRDRTRLYRGLELIGYWSMLDVFVAALLTALVQFGALGTIEPRPGILFFGLVVILTMLATLSFDPRLIWDTDANDD